MSVPFRFSVGDFVSTIELVHDMIEALKDSTGSSASFQGLIRELYSLERALLVVKALKIHPTQQATVDAIKQAATQCQITIDAFLQKNSKFQYTLGARGLQCEWKCAMYKIQWRVYRKDDVEEFRAALNSHVSSINMLLLTVQM
jgi:hypothetical protein